MTHTTNKSLKLNPAATASQDHGNGFGPAAQPHANPSNGKNPEPNAPEAEPYTP